VIDPVAPCRAGPVAGSPRSAPEKRDEADTVDTAEQYRHHVLATDASVERRIEQFQFRRVSRVPAQLSRPSLIWVLGIPPCSEQGLRHACCLLSPATFTTLGTARRATSHVVR
jgi:hypothetical protein